MDAITEKETGFKRLNYLPKIIQLESNLEVKSIGFRRKKAWAQI